MRQNMRAWVDEMIRIKQKKALPVLSFPGTVLLGKTVREVISDSDLYAKGLQLVAERVPMAAAVSFMDLSVEAECFGSQIRTSDYEVPTVVGHILEEEEDADALAIPAIGSKRTGITIEAVRKAAQLITDRPVFAGIIGPFSLAGRLTGVSEAMILCMEEPDMIHTVMKKTTAFLIEYCKAFKAAGASGVVMAEPLTGILSPALAEEFSEPYCRQITEAIQDDTFLMIYHNCGGAVPKMLDSILSVGAAAYHFGNAVSMKEILEKTPDNVLVLGNVDPSGEFRSGTPESVRAAARAVLNDCGTFPNFVLSSGCDIPPAAPWENIDAFFAAAAEYYGQ